MHRQAIEDYLKTIYELAEKDARVSTSQIAEAMQVKPASVTNMMKRLAALNLVNYKKSYGVTLTSKGKKIALKMIRHHRLIELFLTQELGFGWEEVHEQAELLEHVISKQFAERIADILGDPQFDPHGDPIPSNDGEIVSRCSEPLSTLTTGHTAVVLRVTKSTDSDLLCYLAELGMVPGAKVSVINVAPFDGPLTLQVDDACHIVGHNIAEIIQVQPTL